MYRIISIAILSATLCFGQLAYPKEAVRTSQSAPEAVMEQTIATTPDLADLVLKATGLSLRLTDLEDKLEKLVDRSKAEDSFRSTEERLGTLSSRLEEMKTAETTGYYHLSQFKTLLQQERNFHKKNLAPVTASLKQISALKRAWSIEKKQWSQWQVSWDEDTQIIAVQSTFSRAQETISKAHTSIFEHLEPLIALEIKGGDLQTLMYSITSKVNNLISDKRVTVSRELSPLMFSSRYFAQFGPELWYQLRGGIHSIIWPDRQFFARQGWVMVLQVLLAIVLSVLLRRSRENLEKLEKLRILAERPFAVGVIVSLLALAGLYTSYLPTLGLFVWVIGWIALARIVGVHTIRSTPRRLIYGLAFIPIMTQFFVVVSLPLPLFRLYVFIVALTGLIVFIGLTCQNHRRKDSPWYTTFGLGLGSLFFTIVAVMEVSGQADLAFKLFDFPLIMLGFALSAWLVQLIARGGLEWAVYNSFLKNISIIHNHGSSIAAKLAVLINVTIGSLFIVAILIHWQVYDSPAEVLEGVLSWGFALGSQQITAGILLSAAALLYGSILAASAIQTLLLKQVFPKRKIGAGVGLSISRLIQYALIFVGFLFSMRVLGVTLTNLTILGGALGVGIGFGLQAIVNNFASGLILLFERPIRVHDYIMIDELWAEVKKIGLRSTVVRTFDGSEIIIPNSDLITNQVNNWTLSERHMRLRLKVGVAYGSDVILVTEILNDCATSNSNVRRIPDPRVLFQNFGESSLDFELRVWISNVDDMLTVASDLRYEIVRRFREAKIEISFPQRDLHLRSVAESAGSILEQSVGQTSNHVVEPVNVKNELDEK